MNKMVTIAAVAVLATAGNYAFAQGTGTGSPSTGQGQGQEQSQRGFSREDASRFLEARIAAIKAGLKLSADQERLWTPVEEALRSSGNQRLARMEQRRSAGGQERPSPDLMQRLETRGALMTENALRASSLATALRPLWDTLSEDQKRIAPRLMRGIGGMGGGGLDWGSDGGLDRHHGQGRRGERRGHGDEHGRMGAMMQHHREMMDGRMGHGQGMDQGGMMNHRMGMGQGTGSGQGGGMPGQPGSGQPPKQP
jgi:hypothetical protein